MFVEKSNDKLVHFYKESLETQGELRAVLLTGNYMVVGVAKFTGIEYITIGKYLQMIANSDFPTKAGGCLLGQMGISIII